MKDQAYIDIFNRYIDGKATQEEVSILIEWLKERKSFSKWLDREWSGVTSKIDPMLQAQMLDKIKAEIYNSKKAPKKKFIFYITRSIGIAAAILLFAVTYLSIDNYKNYNKYNQRESLSSTLIVKKGQKSNVILPDGSVVWVNSDSKITYSSNYNYKERVINLEGEAYFEVAKDTEKPFIVKTEGMSVRATGTSFVVKSYPEDFQISVVLIEGGVAVSIPTLGSEVELNANEQITLDRNTNDLTKTTISDAVDYSAWINDELVFTGESFGNIAKTLERQYNIEISFASESLKNYRFTGTIGNTSIESVLRILAMTSPLTYKISDHEIIIGENKKYKRYYE